jgi:hypothetical protein
VLANLQDVGLSADGGSEFLEEQQQDRQPESANVVAEATLSCGFDTVSVPLNEPYTACSEGADKTDLCDRGCTATYGPTGPFKNETLVVDNLVEACPSTVENAAKRYFSTHGIKHCPINTRFVGQYVVRAPIVLLCSTRKGSCRS